MSTRRRRHAAVLVPFVLALGAAAPASAQNAWHNPYTGRNWNNPGSSMIDTFLQNDARRRMLMQQGASPGSAASSQTDSRDPSFRLTNRAAAALNELYVSPVESDQWGTDRLGRGVLPPGQAFVIRLAAGLCRNDIRAVFADGRVAERRGVDTCALTDIALP